MSGLWYLMATVAIGLVVRWYIRNDSGSTNRQEKRRWRAADFAEGSNDLD